MSDKSISAKISKENIAYMSTLATLCFMHSQWALHTNMCILCLLGGLTLIFAAIVIYQILSKK